MNNRKALAMIETEIGTMAIYFNGIGEEMTAEKGDHVECIGIKPKSFEDASGFIHVMYCTRAWPMGWLE